MAARRPLMRTEFDNRPAQVVGTGCSILFAVIGLAGLSQPGSRWTGLVWLAFGIFSARRAWRSSKVVVTDNIVETRSMVRTRRFRVADLRGVEVAVGRTGMNGFGREYLVLHLKDRDDFSFKELNAKPRTDARETIVRQAASSIEAAIAQRGA